MQPYRQGVITVLPETGIKDTSWLCSATKGALSPSTDNSDTQVAKLSQGSNQGDTEAPNQIENKVI